ncbi:asparaginase/glutaminase [Chloropicon primus]|uniref:asparaginase n=1 Tax=Chloropicon primus TaxID=1764295 RepID=A0A5B8MK23_9CHLO|nr:asparaginase/glutaminase [Chloropicon primus]UPQ99999.1 asparaginase/glutaminase [Chloropicon primus]|eukprot:QDZ20787.1 asparaginase/glutaminase [Chloropicon primus]
MPVRAASSSRWVLGSPRRREVAVGAKGKKGGKKANGIGDGVASNFEDSFEPRAVAFDASTAMHLQNGAVQEVEFLQDPKEIDLEVLSRAETQIPVLQQAPGPMVPAQRENVQLQAYLNPLPRVLLLHTGGTLGMDPNQSYVEDSPGSVHMKEGTGGHYPAEESLQPGEVLSDLLTSVPELTNFAHLDVNIVFNMDSCRLGPKQWVQLAKLLDKERNNYDAFLIVHGTDTMSFTAAALSLMLKGFKKPIVLTGSQLPLAMPRSDARQNLIDSITCATAASIKNPLSRYPVHFEEVAVCFGGKLMRGNRTRKVHSSMYSAFDSPMYPHLAELGVEVEWNHHQLLKAQHDVYQPRFKLNTNVIRIPIVPGVDPRKAYGDLYGRGVRGVVLEVFGVGNMPDNNAHGWLPWLKQQRKKGLLVYLCSQCSAGNLHPELYRSGSVALNMGVESGKQMTPECAVIKMMFCLEYSDIPLSQPIAGEL